MRSHLLHTYVHFFSVTLLMNPKAAGSLDTGYCPGDRTIHTTVPPPGLYTQEEQGCSVRCFYSHERQPKVRRAENRAEIAHQLPWNQQ